jgi:hypothetical protein
MPAEPSDPLDRLEHVAERVVNRVEYEQGNRRGLLWVHACMGLLAGPQMLLWGSATTIETALGVWSRVLMASLGFFGGVLLASGLSRRPRSIPLEVAGLALVGLWDGLMALGLIYARVKQNDYHLIPLGQPLPAGYVVAYPITVYAGLLALICIHLYTLRRLKRRGHKK